MPASPSRAAYQVELAVFQGPLGVLLQLIEHERLDISVISLAQVADQFLSYVRSLETVDAGSLADFLVMAARLIWIKSRTLLPMPAPVEEDQEEDPAETLARQLREYKRFKEAAGNLRAIEERGWHSFTRDAEPPPMERRLETRDLSLDDLLAAARSAFANPPAPMLPDGVIVPFTLTIDDQIGLIRRVTAGGRSVSFLTLLRTARRRLEIIVTLLAVLELVKRGQVSMEQSEMFGEIMIAQVAGAEITEEEPENGNRDAG